MLTSEVQRNQRLRMGSGADLDWMLARAREHPYNPGPVVKLPCDMVLTMRHEVFIVKCRCMVGTSSVPNANFYGYDWLGTTRDPNEISTIWRKHLEDNQSVHQ
jgi:hypothetical protein